MTGEVVLVSLQQLIRATVAESVAATVGRIQTTQLQ